MLPPGSWQSRTFLQGGRMIRKVSIRRAAALLGALIAAAAMTVAAPAAAQAAQPTTAIARPAAVAQPAAGTVVFTPIAKHGVVPAASFACSVTYPYVTDTYSTGEFSWSAAVGCNIVLRMQGTTVLFQWGSSNAYAFGSSYDHYASYSTSAG